jgi:DHA2 family multidrug resistance protein
MSADADAPGRATTADSDAPTPATDQAPINPWVPLTVVMAATVMVVLDSTIVNVALHQIGLDLHAGDGIEWIVTAYLLAVCIAQPATGWLADRFGRKRVFLSSLIAFTVASALCATAPSLVLLVGFRALQGLGGGALMPVGMTMVFEMFPRHQHGRAIAVWGMAAMVAPAIGPTLGGWLVTSVSWHWMFLINVPIGALALFAGLRLLPDIGHREIRAFDGTGLGLGGAGVAVAILGIAEGSVWGWSSAATIGCIVGGSTLLVLFVRHELRVEQPLIELRMFEQRSFSLAMAVLVFVMVAQYARLVFVPLQLESLRGYTALKVGLMFFVPAILTAVGMSLGGRLVDRRGPRLPIVAGCIGMVVAMASFSQLSLTTPGWAIIGLLSVQGFSMGVTMSPTMVAGLGDLPARLVAQGSAVRSLISQLSGAVAVAVLGAVVVSKMGTDPSPQQAQNAYNLAFAVAAGGAVIALALASRLPSGAAAHDPIHTDALLAE